MFRAVKCNILVLCKGRIKSSATDIVVKLSGKQQKFNLKRKFLVSSVFRMPSPYIMGPSRNDINFLSKIEFQIFPKNVNEYIKKQTGIIITNIAVLIIATILLHYYITI